MGGRILNHVFDDQADSMGDFHMLSQGIADPVRSHTEEGYHSCLL